MKELLEYIVSNLVTNPEAVIVTENKGDGTLDLLLTVDPADMGLIIGKGGATIRAIRKLLTVRAIAENIRINIQLVEPEGGKTPIDSSSEEESEETPTVTE